MVMDKDNYFDRQRRVLRPGMSDIIQKTKVGIVGAGALGQSVAENLALMGFRRFVIVDFDEIEPSNLSRSTLFRKEDVGKPKAEVAAKRLREIALAENLEVEFINGDLMVDVGKGLFWDCDIIVCAVDTMNCRAYINDWCVRAGKPFFEGGFTDYQINISGFAPEGNTYPVCLRDEIGEGDFSGKRNSCSGLKIKDAELKVLPTIQFTAAMAGAIIAKEIVLFLEGRSSVIGKTLFYWGLNNESFDMIITPNPNLKIREEAFMPVTPVNVTLNPTVEQMVKAIEAALGQSVVVALPDTFVVSGHCNACGKEMVINRRKSLLWDDERWCETCRKKEGYHQHLDYNNEWVSISEVTSSSTPEILQRHLRDLGIPKDDVLEVTYFENEDFVTKHVRLAEHKPRMKMSSGKPIEPFSLGEDPEVYYAGRQDVADDMLALKQIQEYFNKSGSFHIVDPDGLSCFLSQQALDDFNKHAMTIYEKRGHEAVGQIVGYYCTDKDHPERKMAIGTHFIPASGKTSHVTCEISVDDGIHVADYCDRHKLLPVCWIHSHPGFGAFYSGTDQKTLLTKYNGSYQFGVVVDILNHQSKAYRAIDNQVKEVKYRVFDAHASSGTPNNQHRKKRHRMRKCYKIRLLNGVIEIIV